MAKQLFHWSNFQKDQIEIGCAREASYSPSFYWNGKLTREWTKSYPYPPALVKICDLLDRIDPTKEASSGLKTVADIQLYSGELLKEFIFEEIRAAEFGSLPSRKNCMYCFDSSIDPNQYMEQMKIPTHGRILIEIEPNAQKSSVVQVRPSLLNCNTLTVPEMRDCARSYWSGTDEVGFDTEVLLVGEYQVKRIVE